MTADAYSGNKTGRKNLSLMVEFFKGSLEIHLLIFGLAWLLLLATTFMASVATHQPNFGQKWWFYGSVHLAFIQALALALFAKGLVRAGNAQWVPGWYLAHTQALVAWLLALAIIPFLLGAAFGWLAAEALDFSLLPWLIFAISAAVVVAFLSPFKEPDTRQILMLVGSIGFLESLLIGSYSSKYFSSFWFAWSLLRDWPWCMALITSCVALVLYRQPTKSSKGTFNTWSLTSLKDTFAIGPKMPNRWLSSRRWPLLNVSFLSRTETFQCLVYFPQLAWVFKSGVLVQINFYWFILVCMSAAISADMKFSRQARMLMWLPSGLSRQTLGKDVFYLLLRRHALLVFIHTLVFSSALLFVGRPVRFLLEPSVVLLAIGYCIFSAGWAASFRRQKTGRIVRGMILALPVFVFGIPLAVAMLATRSGPYLISEPMQITLAIAFALAGWYVGQRHTAHWGQQEFEGLLRPAKRLT